MDVNVLAEILRSYGALGLLLVLFVYIILKGRISFEYQRPEKKK